MVQTLPFTYMWENKVFFLWKIQKNPVRITNSNKTLRTDSKSIKAVQQQLQTWLILGFINPY